MVQESNVYYIAVRFKNCGSCFASVNSFRICSKNKQ